MKLATLFTVLGLMSAVTAAPSRGGSKHLQKRSSLPRMGGINIAGCDFGIDIWGTSGTSYCPGTDQIAHFVNQGANVIRLPFGWQYMMGNNHAATSLDSSFFATYDKLVQATLNAGAYAMLDLHNYARWNGGVIGVDGPSNDDFARVWGLLAKKYAGNSKVMFGLMNEPHDLDIAKFATSCQAAVTAIRNAGATSQAIVLPGNAWDGAWAWSAGNNDALLSVYDPSHSDKSLLILDVHKYFDSDGSGQATECTTNGLDMLQPLQAYLKGKGRQAIISETGGGSTSSCQSNIKTAMQYVKDNSDVFLGFTAWSAGSFEPYPKYSLSLTPNSDGSDNALWNAAFKPFLPGNSGGSGCTVANGAQCGGSGYSGCTTCASGLTCNSVNTYWSQCGSPPATAGCTVANGGQCGGTNYLGCTTCASGGTCTYVNSYWSECQGGASTCSVADGAQCGGSGYTGCTSCVSGLACNKVNDYWSQCGAPAATAGCTVATGGQCGGTNYIGCTKCATGSCTYVNAYWSECQAAASCTVASGAQCGGEGYTGCTTCASGLTCNAFSTYWSQCGAPAATAGCTVAIGAQCGGTGYIGCKTCKTGTCTYVNEYWSQCNA